MTELINVKIVVVVFCILWTLFWLTVHFKRTVDFKIIRVSNLFIFFYIIFIHIGTYLVYLKLDPISLVDLRMSSDNTILMMLIYSHIFIPIFVIALFLFDTIIKLKTKDIYHYDNSSIIIFNLNNNKIKKIIILFFILAIGVFFLYAQTIPSIPILSLLKGDIDTLVMSRQLSVGDLYTGKLWLYKMFYYDLTMIIHLLVFTLYFIDKKKKWFKLFILVSLWMMFILVFDGQKAPIILYFILLVVYYSWLLRLKIKPTHIFGIIIIVLLVNIWIIFSYMYFMGRLDYSLIVQEATHRIFTGQLQGLYSILEKFDDNLLWGRSFPPFLVSLFNGNYYNLELESKYYIHFMGKIDLQYIGLAPTVFWGEMYANFGSIGMFISMFIVSSFLRMIDYLSLNKKKTLIHVVLFAYLSLRYSKLAMSRLSPFIVDFNLVFIIICLLLIQVYSTKAIKY